MTSPPASAQVFLGIQGILTHEAWLLDGHRYEDWLELLAQDISYVVPVATTLARGTPASRVSTMAHLDEDRYSLAKRVERLLTDHAWTEDPPSRTRRFVTNVWAGAGQHAGEWRVRSYLLLFRSRGERAPEWLSAERQDVWRGGEDSSWLLASRRVALDESVLRTQNLAVFL